MRLARILDIGADPADDPDLRIRKRTAVATAFVLMTVVIAFGLADVVLGQPVFAALAVLQIAAFATALVLFHRSHRLAPFVAIMTITGLAVLFVSLIPSDGLSAGAADLIWIILAPLAAVLFVGPRAAGPALAAMILVVLVVVVIDPYVRTAPQAPALARSVFTAIDIIVPAALALALVVFIDGERLRARPSPTRCCSTSCRSRSLTA